MHTENSRRISEKILERSIIDMVRDERKWNNTNVQVKTESQKNNESQKKRNKEKWQQISASCKYDRY
jgi:hypothetical protein